LTPLANIVADHPWRKPKPGVLLQAVSDLGLDPARCAILGDKISDIDAGAAAGIGLRVTHRAALMPKRVDHLMKSYEVVADLGEAPVLR
jgi:histidinol phosphatase-like enzyme